MIGKSHRSTEYYDLSTISESTITYYYLKIPRIPYLMNSPFREDNHPSFGLYYSRSNSNKVLYKDYSTNESGNIFTLLKKLFHCSNEELYKKIYNDFSLNNVQFNTNYKRYNQNKSHNSVFKLECKVRKWEDYDIKYWRSYGVSLKWLKMADIYPISHKIITFNNANYLYKADKYAYVFAEFKDNKTTLKIYQPFSNKYKWCNSHNSSILSLWTKLPKTGKNVCICSSLKDALCLWANIGIPAIAVQGEGYPISDTVIKELKKRFKHIFICFDCDEPGLKMGKALAEKTHFFNVVLKYWDGCKDISDYYKYCNENNILNQFKDNLISVFKEAIQTIN